MTFSELPALPRADDFERLLFASARQDEVPGSSRQRVALALGIDPQMTLGGALEPSRLGGTARSGAPEPLQLANTEGSGTPEGASVAVTGTRQSQLGLLGKSALVGLAGGAIAVGVAVFGRSAPVTVATTTPLAVESSPFAPMRESTPAMLESPRAEPARDATARAVRLAASTQRPKSATAAPKRVAKPIAAASARASSAADATGATDVASGVSRLLAEVRRLDAARNALAAGHASQALAELQRYEREFPAGTLAQDAALLEVRALDRSGQRAAAHHRARELLSRAGAERHRAELEAIINPLASGSKARRLDIEEAR
jgi:hypothetical protein